MVDLSIILAPMVRAYLWNGVGLDGLCEWIGSLYVRTLFVKNVHTVSAQWFECTML